MRTGSAPWKATILVIEDDPDQVLLYRKALKTFRLRSVDTATGALSLLEEEIPDVIILDHLLAHAERGTASKRIIVGYGFWIFLLSDIVMFSAFFASYAVLKDGTAGGPRTGHDDERLAGRDPRGSWHDPATGGHRYPALAQHA